MSKKYVFLTYAITSIGGGQIYCKNKLKYCNEQGFDTYVFSSYKSYNGKVFIKELEKFLPLVIDELDFYPTVFNQKVAIKLIEKILEEIDYKTGDEIIIESHTEYLAMWGEMIAKKINAKHIIYLLGEHFDGLSNSVLNFLDYKFKRKELACIKKLTMQKMFSPYKTIPEEDCLFLQATLGVPVEDIEIPDEYTDKCVNKKVIGIIGRGDKNYVTQAVKDVCEFAEKHKQDQFALIVVGSIMEGFSDKQKELVESSENIELIMTGEQFPIPRKLLQLMNVCFASAGCVRPPYYEGVPTITMDAYDNKPIGVMGYDTLLTFTRENEEIKTAEYYLDGILNGDLLEKYEFVKPEPVDFNKAYGKHFEFIENSQNQKEYYEILNIAQTKKEKIFSLLYKIGGVKLIRRVREIKRKY